LYATDNAAAIISPTLNIFAVRMKLTYVFHGRCAVSSIGPRRIVSPSLNR
jgi:hypothetical protein